MSLTVWPWADINTTIARRSFTGSFALRLIPCSFWPSSILTGRTNTLGRHPTSTSKSRCWGQSVAPNDQEVDYLAKAT